MKANNPAEAKKYFEAKMAFTTGTFEVSQAIEKGEDIVIVDMRDADSYGNGHIPGSRNLPEEQWDTFKGLDKAKLNVLYCYSQTCHKAARAAILFASKGYPVMEMEGGFDAWQKGGYPMHEAGKQSSEGVKCLC